MHVTFNLNGFLSCIGIGLLMVLLASCNQKSDLPDPLEAGWEGETVCEVIQQNKKLRVLRCSFPPGVGHEKHYHNAHFGYTLAGSRFRMTDSNGTRELDIPTGTNFYNDKIEWHEVVNIGDSLAVFLIVEPL